MIPKIDFPAITLWIIMININNLLRGVCLESYHHFNNRRMRLSLWCSRFSRPYTHPNSFIDIHEWVYLRNKQKWFNSKYKLKNHNVYLDVYLSMLQTRLQAQTMLLIYLSKRKRKIFSFFVMGGQWTVNVLLSKNWKVTQVTSRRLLANWNCPNIQTHSLDEYD